jgi:hypothetical protein
MWLNVLILLAALILAVEIAAFVKYRRILKVALGLETGKVAACFSRNWQSLANGTSGDIMLEMAWLSEAQELFGLFAQKNHDYGSMNLSLSWMQGVTVRMGDKVSRLWNLVGLNGEQEAAVKDESLVDTFQDIANYALIGSLMAKGKWPRIPAEQGFGIDAIFPIVEGSVLLLSDEQQDTIVRIIEESRR